MEHSPMVGLSNALWLGNSQSHPIKGVKLKPECRVPLPTGITFGLLCMFLYVQGNQGMTE